MQLSYRIWGSVDDPFRIDETELEKLDEAVEWGLRYDIHTNIAIHRGPGYCINKDEKNEEKLDLWCQQETLEAFKEHWRAIARRYKNITSDKLTFNVVNEPYSKVSPTQYSQVIWDVITAVREITPDRTFFVDGIPWGDHPHIDSLLYGPDNIILSTRGYNPRELTHYMVHPNYNDKENPPTWSGAKTYIGTETKFSKSFSREDFEKYYGMYAALAEIYKVGVICGEFGCGNHTPHDVTLAWLEDLLSVLKEYNIGWAMWNLSGEFGVLDSMRDDVDYEDYCGRKLDRKMLNLLQKY